MKAMFLKPGSVGEDVYTVHHILKKLEYRISDIGNRYNHETKAAVESFQNDSGFAVTGIVDTKTYNSLKKLYEMRFPDDKLPTGETEKTITETINKHQINPHQTINQADTSASDENSKRAKAFSVIDKNELNRNGYTNELNNDCLHKIEASEIKPQKEIEDDELSFEKKIDYDSFFEPGQDYTQAIQEALTVYETEDELSDVEISTSKKGSPEYEALAYPILKEGSRNVYVRIIQTSLRNFGFYDGNIDGILGPKTVKSIKDFQSNAGLKVDGIAGEKTWRAIENHRGNIVAESVKSEEVSKSPETSASDWDAQVEKVKRLQKFLSELGQMKKESNGILKDEKISEVKKVQEDIIPEDTGLKDTRAVNKFNRNSSYPVIKEGDTEDHVKLLQIRLKELGIYKGYIDSSFGADTFESVKVFQERAGLYPDGIVNAMTWARLNASQISMIDTESPSDENIASLQEKLYALGYYKADINGVYSEKLKKAIQDFQSSVGLIPDGIVGSVTWETLAREFILRGK